MTEDAADPVKAKKSKKGKKGKKAKAKAKKVREVAGKAKAKTGEKATNAFDGVIEAIDNLASDKKR